MEVWGEGFQRNSGNTMQKTRRNPLRVLIVDHDPDSVALVSRHLSGAGYEVLTASSGDEAIKTLASEGASIVVTDWIMPGLSGLDLCRAIRDREEIGFAYVIVLTAQTTEDQLVEAFEGGADDYLTKPFNHRELLARIRAGERIIQLRQDLEGRQWEVHRINAEMSIAHSKLAEANQQLNRLATTDELTGLLNRREAMSRLAEAWSVSVRRQSPLACISLDIDHFKNFNDVHGHAIGDTVLRAVAEALRSTVRSGEPVYRIGGEEFLVLCPDATEAQAAIAAERLRETVEQRVVRVNRLELAVTVSLGVAERTRTMTVPDELLRVADDALYGAKDAGRNRSFRASDLRESEDSSTGEPAQAKKENTRSRRRDGASGTLRILLADADTASRTTCKKALEG